jgi:rhodanese-related sulfurtransferase
MVDLDEARQIVADAQVDMEAKVSKSAAAAASANGSASPVAAEAVQPAAVAAAVSRSTPTLVSVRSWPEYIGATSGYSYIAAKGDIPTALFAHSGSTAQTLESYRAGPESVMRPYDEIERLLRRIGLTPERRAVFYCGTGWRASEVFFYARCLGWDNVAVFDGGWLEWSEHQKPTPLSARIGITGMEPCLKGVVDDCPLPCCKPPTSPAEQKAAATRAAAVLTPDVAAAAAAAQAAATAAAELKALPGVQQHTIQQANGSYLGALNSSGQREGFGVFRFNSGDSYRGMWSSSLRHGLGVYRFADGRQFAGHWYNGERKGAGMWTLADGACHVGLWAKSVCEGYGVRYAPDGSLVQQGWWQDDAYVALQKPADWMQVIGGTAASTNGISPSAAAASSSSPSMAGIHSLHSPTGTAAGSAAAAAAGRQACALAFQLAPTAGEMQFTLKKHQAIYVGELKEGKKCGYGVASFPGGASYRGQWRDDCFQGRGTYTFPDGRVHSGDMFASQFLGLGVATFPDGRRHEGCFARGQRHGLGIAYRADCSIEHQGWWQNDLFVGSRKPNNFQ